MFFAKVLVIFAGGLGLLEHFCDEGVTSYVDALLFFQCYGEEKIRLHKIYVMDSHRRPRKKVQPP